MLTFEMVKDGDAVEIHGDSAGLRYFAGILHEIAESREHDHVHLSTPKWGGAELSEVNQGLDNTLLNKATIYIWPNYSPNALS